MNLDDGSTSWVRGCRDKHRFFTKSEAKATAKKLAKKTGRPMYAYTCRHCDGAHVTSKVPDRIVNSP